jgi:hypothetical protein
MPLVASPLNWIYEIVRGLVMSPFEIFQRYSLLYRYPIAKSIVSGVFWRCRGAAISELI